MLRGDSSWQTRSTVPMSMPSSSEAVATSARISPALRRCLQAVAALLGEAAVVRADVLLADALREVEGDALGEAAGVHEDERGRCSSRAARRSKISAHCSFEATEESDPTARPRRPCASGSPRRRSRTRARA